MCFDRRIVFVQLLALALILVGALTGAATQAPTYRLRLELIATSESTVIELEGATMFVQRWSFPSNAWPSVSGHTSIEAWKPCCIENPMSVSFEVLVIPDGGSDLIWHVSKGSVGFWQIYIYAWGEDDADDPPLLLKCNARREGAQSFALSLDELIASSVPVAPSFDPTSETFRDREEILDLGYAEIPGVDPLYLSLDLRLPARDLDNPVPLVIWLHGGGWVKGDKSEIQLYGEFVGQYAVASVNYRLADVDTFPAQLHDCKAAVRWLRANAAEYGYDPDRIVVWGASAGGHLAVTCPPRPVHS